MDKCRSFYLDSRQNDFAEPIEEACRLDFTDIPLVDPANDNEAAREQLSARGRALIQSWSRLSEQFFRFDKWSLCRG